MDVRHQARPQRDGVCLIVEIKKLVLYLRHVNVRGAFRFTRFALEAEIKDLEHSLRTDFVDGQCAGHRGPECVGASAGGVLLFPGRHVRGTHRTGVDFPASANPVASFDCAGKPAVGAPIEFGCDGFGGIVFAVTEILTHVRRVEDLAGVHDAFRVEQAFYFPEMFDQLGAEHLLGPSSSNYAVAMFAAQRTAEFENEIGNLVGDVVHPVDTCGLLKIDERTDVEASYAGVPIISGFGSVPFHDLVETFDIFRQPLG